jgi:hypothetical protein
LIGLERSAHAGQELGLIVVTRDFDPLERSVELYVHVIVLGVRVEVKKCSGPVGKVSTLSFAQLGKLA